MAASGFNPAMMAGAMGGGGGKAPMGLSAGLPGILQGFFGDSGAPYRQAADAYKPYLDQATSQQNPFYNAGTSALPQYQGWLDKMKDPSAFYNNLMGDYKQSPQAQYLQNQSTRAATNAASASGMTGSTPFMQQIQQNSSNIASGDMNNWLQQVLGINNQYGAGEHELVQGGQHAGDILSQLFSGAADYMGSARFGQEAGRQQDRNAMIGGIASMFGG